MTVLKAYSQGKLALTQFITNYDDKSRDTGDNESRAEAPPPGGSGNNARPPSHTVLGKGGVKRAAAISGEEARALYAKQYTGVEAYATPPVPPAFLPSCLLALLSPCLLPACFLQIVLLRPNPNTDPPPPGTVPTGHPSWKP
jgi:hypothetical protein